MNVTKTFSGYFRIILLSAVTYGTVNTSAKADSHFTLPLGKTVHTKFDSISTSLNSTFGSILGGYIINKDGENIPYIGLIDENDTASKYWPINEGYISQFFEREDKYYALLSTGKALKINKHGLSDASFEFKPNSLIIAQTPVFIACTKIGRSKLSSSKVASCYQIDRAWDTNVYWTRLDIKPNVCDGNLKILVGVDQKQNWKVVTLNTETGQELSSRKVAKPKLSAPICQL